MNADHAVLFDDEVKSVRWFGLHQEFVCRVAPGASNWQVGRQIVMETTRELALVADLVEQRDISYVGTNEIAKASSEHQGHEVHWTGQRPGIALQRRCDQVGVS